MPKYSTKYLTREAALMVVQNFRWFARFKVSVRKLGPDRYKVTAPRWCWSFIVLVKEDYA